MGKRKNEFKSVVAFLAEVIDKIDQDADVDPALVAHEAIMKMDSMMVQKIALVALRQFARGLLRKRFEPKDDIEAPDSLFPELQSRYPRSRVKGEPPRYAPLRHMTKADIAYNVSQLRRGGHGRLAHANRLEKFGEEHIDKESPHE